MKMFADEYNIDIPEDTRQLLEAMYCAVNSDNRFFVDIGFNDEDISKLKFIETKNLLIENVMYSELEYHVPLWVATTKDGANRTYLDTESLIELCKDERICRFMYNHVLYNDTLSFVTREKEIKTVNELQNYAENINNFSFEDIKKDIHMRLFGYEDLIKPEDLYLANRNSGLVNFSVVCFNYGDFKFKVDDIDNPRNINISSNYGSSEINLVEDNRVSSINDMIRVLNNMNLDNYRNIRDISSSLKDYLAKGLSPEEIVTEEGKKHEEKIDKATNNFEYVNIETYTKEREIFSHDERTLKTLFSAIGPGWDVIMDDFYKSGALITFDETEGIIISSDKISCLITTDDKGFKFYSSNDYGETTIQSYSSLKEALLEAHEQVADINKYTEKYPELSKLYFARDIIDAIEKNNCTYQEINGIPTIDLNGECIMKINNRDVEFHNTYGSNESIYINSPEDIKNVVENIECKGMSLRMVEDYPEIESKFEYHDCELEI